MACTIDQNPGFTGSLETARVPAYLPNLPREVGRLARWMRLASRRRRQRQALLELDDYHLSDIGITREAAKREAAKSFWL